MSEKLSDTDLELYRDNCGLPYAKLVCEELLALHAAVREFNKARLDHSLLWTTDAYLKGTALEVGEALAAAEAKLAEWGLAEWGSE